VTYVVKEELAPAGSCWFQTFPAGNAHEVTVVADKTTAAGDFGNACEKTSTGGYTLGYWSNKNGGASLDGYNDAEDPETWQAFLGSYNLVGKTGADYDPTTLAAFRTWLLKADATNMSYMLSVQMAATLLNMEVKGTSYAGYGVLDMDGEWISIADLIVKANTFLGDNEVTVDAGAARTEAEFYKNVFDKLNNNCMTIIPFDACPVPDFGCEPAAD
jgi:hypothetical protein